MTPSSQQFGGQEEMIEEILYLLAGLDEEDEFELQNLQRKIEGMFGEDCWDILIEEIEDYPELLKLIPAENAFNSPNDWEKNAITHLEEEIEKQLAAEIYELLQQHIPVEDAKRTSSDCKKESIKPVNLKIQAKKKPLNVIVRFECDEDGEITRASSCITDGENIICDSCDLHESYDSLDNCLSAKHLCDSAKKGLIFALESDNLKDYLG